MKKIKFLLIVILVFYLLPINIVKADNNMTEDEIHASVISQFILLPLGDFFSKSVNSMATDMSEEEAKAIIATKEDINKINNLKNKIDIKEWSKEEYSQNINKKIATYKLQGTIMGKNGVTEHVFNKDTAIPILPMDIYTMSIGKSDLLDINFWSLSKDNNNSIWNYINNIVQGVAKGVLYISIALIITMIIWRTILFILAVIGQQPEKITKQKKLMDNIFSTIILVVGIYIFMAGCSILYDKALIFLFKNNSQDYPVRLIVEEVYSFNTTIIGALRYNSLTTNTWHQIGWSIFYLIFSMVSFGYFCLLFLRVLIIGFLTIIAPLIGVMRMTSISTERGVVSLLQINRWTKLYLKLMVYPLVIAFIINTFFL